MTRKALLCHMTDSDWLAVW